MSISSKLDRFLVGVGNLVTKGPSVGPLRDDHTIYRSLRQVLMEGQNLVSYPYKQSIWVYASINAIADNLSRVPLRIKKDNGDKEPIVIEEGPIYELFQNPNPYMTQEDLVRATMIFLGLRGEAFWILEGRDNISQIPKAIWVFDPTRFEPLFEKSGELQIHVGWKYRRGNFEEYFSTSEVIQFKYFNPYDDLRGLAPLEAGKASMDQDWYATQYNTAFFKNGAEPGGIIAVEGELTDDQFNRIVKQFEDRHKGVNKAHKIALVEGGGKFYEAQVNQRDMQFIEGKKLTREEIIAAYKVNQVVLGIYKDVKSYEGIKSAHKAFWEECLMPKVMYIEGVLWAKLFSKIGVRRGRGKVWAEFDLATVGALQTNYADTVDVGFKMWSMGWPINAINKRLKLGMEDVKWGNEWWVPGGFLPVTALLDYSATPTKPGKQPVNTPGPTGTNPPPEKPDAEKPAPKKPAPKKELTGEERIQIEYPDTGTREAVLGLSYNEILMPLEQVFKSKTKRFLFEQRKKVLACIYARPEGQAGVNIVLDTESETRKLENVLKQLYNEALGSGYTSFCGEVQADSSSLQKTGMSNSYVESKASFMSRNFMDLTVNLITQLTAFISSRNPTNDDAALKAREIYNLLSGKCSLLASKEAFIAYAYGRTLAIRDHGTEQHKRFIASFMKNFEGPMSKTHRLEGTRDVQSN